MKASLCLFLAIIAIALCAPKAHAQDGTAIDVPSIYVPDVPTRPLVPPTVQNPRFPLLVKMDRGHWYYNGNHESKGDGSFRLVSDDSQFSYKYRCAWSFRTRGKTYPARWLKPGEKLEILMSKPGSDHTAACTLHTHA